MTTLNRTAQASMFDMFEKTEKTEKTERLEVRVTPELKQYALRAAAHAHQTLSDFVAASLYEMAKQIIREHEVMTLTARDATAFIEALSTPVPTPPKLAEAAERYKALMGKMAEATAEAADDARA